MWDNNTSDQSNNASEGNVSIITDNDKEDKGISTNGKIIDEEIVKYTKIIKIKQNTLDTAPNVLDYNKSDQGHVSMITNNERGGKEIVTSGKIIDEEIVKDTTNIEIKQNTLNNSQNVIYNNKSDQNKHASE